MKLKNALLRAFFFYLVTVLFVVVIWKLILPAVFGASDRTGTSGDDVTGAVLQTTFKF